MEDLAEKTSEETRAISPDQSQPSARSSGRLIVSCDVTAQNGA